MDDRRLAALLERATDDPAPDLRDRVRSAVHQELERPVRSRWRWGMVAAGVAAAVAAVVAWAALDDGWRLETGPAGGTDGTHLLPQQWPEGLDGPTHVDELSAVAPPFRPEPASFLVSGEHAAFATVVATEPFAADMSGTSGREVLPDGREVQTVAGEAGSWAFVEVSGSRSVLLGSAVSPEELARVAAAFTDESGRPELHQLPETWGWAENPPAAAHVAVGATPEELDGWWLATRSAPSPSGLGRRVQVLIGPAEDPELVLSQVRDLTAGFAEDVDVDGRAGVLVTVTAQVETQSLMTSPSEGTLAVVTGTEVTASELGQVAASLEPVPDEEWAELVGDAPPFTVGRVPDGYEPVAAAPGAGEQEWGLDCCGTQEPATVLSPSGRSDDPGVVVVSAVGFYAEVERGMEGGLHQSSAGYFGGSVAFEHEGAEAYFTRHRTTATRTTWSDLLIATGEGAAVRVSGPERTFDELLEVFRAVEPVTEQTAAPPSVEDPPLGLRRVGSVHADLVIAVGAGARSDRQPPSARSLAWRSDRGRLLVSTFPDDVGDLDALAALRLPSVALSRTTVDGRPALLVESSSDTWPMRSLWTETSGGDLLMVAAEGEPLLSPDALAEVAASVR